MPETKTEEKHITTTTVSFTDSEVASILGAAALEDARGWPSKRPYPSYNTPGRNVEIEITQLTEGSPPYNIDRWKARVVVTEDHLAASAPVEERKS